MEFQILGPLARLLTDGVFGVVSDTEHSGCLTSWILV